jgi:hypothetical protein
MQSMKRIAGLVFLFLLALSAFAHAQTWTDWTVSATVNGVTSVTGKLELSNVTVTGPAMLPAQLGVAGEVNFWQSFPSTYSGGPVLNAPDTSDAVRLQGPGTYTITFSEPVTDPVMGLLSLGGLAMVTLDFGVQPVILLKTGPGAWGVGLPLAVVGNTVIGKEGNGLVQFPGTMTTLIFNADVTENWWGFTIGAPTATPPPVDPPPFTLPPLPPLAVGPGPTVTLEWEYPIDAADLLIGVGGG